MQNSLSHTHTLVCECVYVCVLDIYVYLGVLLFVNLYGFFALTHIERTNFE